MDRWTDNANFLHSVCDQVVGATGEITVTVPSHYQRYLWLETMAAMDVERLHVVLQQSFSPDANLRGPAEETIRNLKHIKGSTALLLQVAAEKQVGVRVLRTLFYTIFQSRRQQPSAPRTFRHCRFSFASFQ